MRASAILVFSCILAFAAPAFGEDVCSAVSSKCACAVPLASFAPGSATLNMQGSVLLEAQNPGTDASTALLNVGDSAIVLANGSAALSFPGGCSASIGPQSSLVIRDLGGCACASVVEATTTAGLSEGGSGAPEPTDGATGPGIGAAGTGIDAATIVGGMAAAGAIGAATYFIVTDDDDDEGSDE
jgi:hypothetical protein